MQSLSTIISRTATAVATTSAMAYIMLSTGVAKAVSITEDTVIQTGSDSNTTTSETFQDQFIALSNNVINTVLIIAGVLATGFLIYSGIQYITASGNPEKAKSARQGIINAVIGIVVVVSAFFIIRFATGLGNQAASQVK